MGRGKWEREGGKVRVRKGDGGEKGGGRVRGMRGKEREKSGEGKRGERGRGGSGKGDKNQEKVKSFCLHSK